MYHVKCLTKVKRFFVKEPAIFEGKWENFEDNWFLLILLYFQGFFTIWFFLLSGNIIYNIQCEGNEEILQFYWLVCLNEGKSEKAVILIVFSKW